MPSRDNRYKTLIPKYDLSEESFHAHSISKNLFDYICSVLPEGRTILELGSGWGTGELAKHYKMYSVEHDLKFVDKYKSTYLHVPLKEHKQLANHKTTLWYDAVILKEKIKGIKYDMLLVDGPPQTRSGFYKYYTLFDMDAILVFDDYNREVDRRVVNSVAVQLKRLYVVHPSDDGKPFAVINESGG